MDTLTYERCPVCCGTLRFRTGNCLCVRSTTPGFTPTGVTTKQLEAFADRERAIAGDPGMPEDKRLAILLKLRSRVSRALGRLTVDVGGEG